MNCRCAQQWLSMVHDGRPAGNEAGAVAEHLRACPACRRFRDALLPLGAQVRSAVEPQPAVDRDLRRLALDRWAADQASGVRMAGSTAYGLGMRRVASVVCLAGVLLMAVVALVRWQYGSSSAFPRSRITRNEEHPHAATEPLPPRRKDRATRHIPTETPDERLQLAEGQPLRPHKGSLSRRPGGPPVPGKATPPRPGRLTPYALPLLPDEQFLDGRDPALLSRWNPMDDREQARLKAMLRQLPPTADDFVQIPLPRLAEAGKASVLAAAAAREYTRQAQVVDTRLFRTVTLRMKGTCLTDLCAQMQEQTGVQFRASRSVADEKVTVFVKEHRARDVMRAVARLLGHHWERAGAEGAYRYELAQDLRSQLVEEEMRNRDANAAVLAMDAQMEKLRPYLDLSFEALQQRSKESKETFSLLFKSLHNAGWAGMQLYHHLGPAERAALAAGQELVFRPDSTNPDLRIPPEWTRPILQSLSEAGSIATLNGQPTRIEDVPGMRVGTVRLKVDRSELGQVSLSVRVTADSPNISVQVIPTDLAIGRSPSLASPANATLNAALRGEKPFDQRVSLKPEPSCVTLKSGKPGPEGPNYYSASIGELARPHVFSGDVWEAVHRETGLPIVADYFTRMHRLDQVTVTDKTLFEALCTVGDAMGVRWTRDGEFLFCRGTSYLWDKLKEVPNRHIQRWVSDRDANGDLPLADVIEMASLPDTQLDSEVVAEAIGHCWGLREWLHPHFAYFRRRLRFLATLTPDQLRRAMGPDRLPFNDLTAAQQQAAMEMQYADLAGFDHKSSPIAPERWANALIYADYAPAGRYTWQPFGPASPMAAGRTMEEALATARRMRPAASPQQVRLSRNGYFHAGVTFHLIRPDSIR